MNAMNNQLTNRFSNAFNKEDYCTIDEVAADLGLKAQRTRQIIEDAVKRRLIQNLTKKDGVKRLYAEPMVAQLKNLYLNGQFGNPKQRKKVQENLKAALMVVKIPVFDPEIKRILMTQFKDESQIVEFLRDKLSETYKPVMTQLKALEDEFESKKKQLLGAA